MGTREDLAIKDILQGRNPNKKIQISTFGLGEEQDKQEKIKKEREEKNKRSTEIIDEINKIYTCKDCGKNVRMVGTKLDDKFIFKTGKCFDCLIKYENKLRIAGTYDYYEKMKVLQNKLSIMKEQREGIFEFKNKPLPEFYNQVGEPSNIEKEKWSMNVEVYQKMADEAIEQYDKLIKEIEGEIKILEEKIK